MTDLAVIKMAGWLTQTASAAASLGQLISFTLVGQWLDMTRTMTKKKKTGTEKKTSPRPSPGTPAN